MNYRGIVFDKDGTLLDFNKTWLPIYRFAALEFSAGDKQLAAALLSRHGYQAALDKIAGGSLLAAGNNAQIAQAWALQLDQKTQVSDLGLRLEQIFRELGAQQAIAVPELAGTLAQLREFGCKLGIATADSYQGILHSLHAFDVLDEFDFLAGYDSGYGNKPDAGMVWAFCEQMSLPAESIIVVGDNRHDIEMGRNAKAGLCVGVLTGTSTRVELETIADFVLPDVSSLPELLKQTE